MKWPERSLKNKPMELNKTIRHLKQRKTDLYGKDFLLSWEKSEVDIQAILEIAEILQSLRSKNISPRIFNSGLGVSIFKDQSTRTRFSFASACNLLGLEVQDMDEEKSQIGHGETIRETANMIAFMTDIIGIRHDIFLGEGNKYMRQVADALDDGYKQDVLPQRPGIINLQCDLDHPTQSLADLLHLKNHFGSLEALRGKKMVMSWAYSPSYGKPLSVPQGIIGLLSRFGVELELAHPKGYELVPEIVELAEKNARNSGGSFKQSHSMRDAMKDADIVYPKSWAPFSIMQQRTALLMEGDEKGLTHLEYQCLEQNAQYQDWEYNAGMEALTKDKNALYMHCLPADISGVSCDKGEVSATIFEKHRINTYLEAGKKPYIIAAMILANRVEDPGLILSNILERGKKRWV
jgi:knotted carbamoyltransferase YgeW